MSGVCDTCKRDRCRLRMDGLKMCDMRLSESNYERLFGTPERAARTLEELELDQINWCHGTEYCESCLYEFDRYGCALPDGFSLLEWLESEVRDD